MEVVSLIFCGWLGDRLGQRILVSMMGLTLALVGMILIGTRALKSKRFGHRTVPAIEFLSYYWHFVDVVWIALFLAIFELK